MDIKDTTNKSSKVKINNFSLLFSNMKESKKLLSTYEKFIQEYYQILYAYYRQLKEINSSFLVEDKFKSSIINSPIFQLGKAIKRSVESHINNIFSIISAQNIFDEFKQYISKLRKIGKKN